MKYTPSLVLFSSILAITHGYFLFPRDGDHFELNFPIPDACNPNHCGDNANCEPYPGNPRIPICKCCRGYIGDPYINCTHDPCTPNPCGGLAICEPRKTLNPENQWIPLCKCPKGYNGDPNIACSKGKIIFWIHLNTFWK